MNTYLSRIIVCLLWLTTAVNTAAQDFDHWFINRTLRVDYSFVGTDKEADLSLIELVSSPGWWGRRHHLDSLALRGNGQITMRDAASDSVIYRTSFSSLFLEWLETDEARTVDRGFENTFLLPYPRRKAVVEITLLDPHHQVRTRLTHTVNPEDILIHEKGHTHITPHRYLLQSGPADRCIDVAILAEGYTEEEMDTFYQDAKVACESLFGHEPFRSMKQRFNIVAVASPSEDSGVSIPRLDQWKNTAFHSHFSTFYSDRYLTTSRLKALHDALAGIDYEHIIVLANTDEYGGGGIYNSYTLTTAHHESFRPVVVHEFGHSFGGLADEYFYEEDIMSDTYPTDVEPWEPNVTTRVNFASKWADLIPEGTPMPTPAEDFNTYQVGLYEGAAYSFKGLYRGSYNCRMRTNDYPAFCPVCQRALRRLIEFYTE